MHVFVLTLLTVIGLPSVPIWLSLLISFAVGLIAALAFHFLAGPRLLRWIEQGKVGDVETNQQRVSVTIVEGTLFLRSFCNSDTYLLNFRQQQRI
jgi:hypothetical protein